MRREGSPWQGLGTVLLKELSDHFDGARMLLLALLMVFAAAVIRQDAADTFRLLTVLGCECRVRHLNLGHW